MIYSDKPYDEKDLSVIGKVSVRNIDKGEDPEYQEAYFFPKLSHDDIVKIDNIAGKNNEFILRLLTHDETERLKALTSKKMTKVVCEKSIKWWRSFYKTHSRVNNTNTLWDPYDSGKLVSLAEAMRKIGIKSHDSQYRIRRKTRQAYKAWKEVNGLENTKRLKKIGSIDHEDLVILDNQSSGASNLKYMVGEQILIASYVNRFRFEFKDHDKTGIKVIDRRLEKARRYASYCKIKEIADSFLTPSGGDPSVLYYGRKGA